MKHMRNMLSNSIIFSVNLVYKSESSINVSFWLGLKDDFILHEHISKQQAALIPNAQWHLKSGRPEQSCI